MNLQDQIRNLKVGDRVRVDGYSECIDGRGGWRIGQACEWTPSAAPIKVTALGENTFDHASVGTHRFRKSSIIEVLTGMCGNCKTNCHTKASDEVGQVCYANIGDAKLSVRRADGWARYSRVGGRRHNTRPSASPRRWKRASPITSGASTKSSLCSMPRSAVDFRRG